MTTIDLPSCLTLAIKTRSNDGADLKFTLRLRNTDNGEFMDFQFSGGFLAFLPDGPEGQALRGRLNSALKHGQHSREFEGALAQAAELAEIKIADVLHSLIRDSQAGAESFDDFCGEFGYDPDSRKAYATWETCREYGEEFDRVIGELRPALEIALADY